MLATAFTITTCFILASSDTNTECKTGLTESVENGLLNQMKNEFRGSQFYLSASYFFTHRHFDGISAHFKKEYKEELEHALNISNYLTNRGSDLTTKIIDIQIQIGNDKSIKEEIEKWLKPIDVFQFLFECEQQNQININDLMTKVLKENDHGTYQFLSELIKAQIIGTSKSERLLAQAKDYSHFESLLWHLDHEIN
eukprot:123168_1